MVNNDFNKIPTTLVTNYQYSAYYKQINVWIESIHNMCGHATT